jgi:hypothetical protein
MSVGQETNVLTGILIAPQLCLFQGGSPVDALCDAMIDYSQCIVNYSLLALFIISEGYQA